MTSTTGNGETKLRFLDLPDEIHSQIASYLTIQELISFLSLHSALLSLTRSHLNPLPALIRETLDRGWPYPSILAKLPSLTLFQPSDDGGDMFLVVLVRARPRWILERLELGRWTEKVWKEAFERRFLPSWVRYKVEGDTWRAVFLRVLGRLEHRNLGCTHDESWTRFITLHRNGSASINRIYSRQFDPYQIYDELKHQNNFAAEPTTVRVVVHLQDVRIIVLGILYRYPSLFVNQNAHDLLHPPLITELAISQARQDEADDLIAQKAASRGRAKSADTPLQAINSSSIGISTFSMSSGSVHPSTTTNEIYYPLVRSLSRSGAQNTSYGLSDGPMPSSSTSQPPSSRRATFSSLLPPSLSKTRRPSTQNISTTPPSAAPPDSPSSISGRLGAMLKPTRSREGDETTTRGGRKWTMGRRNSGGVNGERSGNSGSAVIPASALFSGDNLYGYGATYGYGLSSGSTTNVAVGTIRNGETESGYTGQVIPASALFGELDSASHPDPNAIPGPSILSKAPVISIPAHTNDNMTGSTPEYPVSIPSPRFHPPVQPPRPQPKQRLPYPVLRKPQPAPSHRFYPNHTPLPHSSSSTNSDIPLEHSSDLLDRRQIHEVVEDDYAGNIWAFRRGEEASDIEGPDAAAKEDEAWSTKERFVEWDEGASSRKRWVGPMLVMAQLHPSHHPRAQPPGVDPLAATEGPDPDLGPKGMYVSLGFEDLEKIMGWVELRGGGAYVADPRRGGMGF